MRLRRLALGVLVGCTVGLSAAPGQALANFYHAATLAASDGAERDRLGASVAVSGEVIVVGAPDERAAYVFEKPAPGREATQKAKLTTSVAPPSFGHEVAIAGDTIVVASVRGAFVFVKPSGGWANATPDAELDVVDNAQSVAVDGDTVVVGDGAGSARVYTKPGAQWANASAVATLTASDSGPSFGEAVAIDGGTVVVGDPYPDAGAAYVFTRKNAGWQAPPDTKLMRSTASHYHLGTSVAVSGDTIVLGAPSDGTFSSGAAYVYVKPAGGWANQPSGVPLTAPNDRSLGMSVAIDGPLIVVGAPQYNVAYAYLKPATGQWTNTDPAALSAAVVGDAGRSVGVAGDTVVVGIPDADFPSSVDQGAAAVFVYDTIPPDKPVLTATDPASPANSNSFKVVGTAEPRARITLASGGGCPGYMDFAGTAEQLSSSGISRTAADNSTNVVRIVAWDAAQNASECSEPITYVEDSLAPVAPTLTATTPATPAAANDIAVRGAAEASAMVRLFIDAACSGTPIGTGPAAALGAAGLPVTVPADTTTTVYATATDAAGNVSPCSSSSVTYQEDSSAPPTPVLSGPTRVVAGASGTYSAVVADGVGSGVDPGAIVWMASGGLGEQRGTTVTFGFLAAGDYTLSVAATDRAGNVSPVASLSVTVVPPLPVDGDGDGVLPPEDCNDGDKNVRPGAVDVPANRIDEDCRDGDAIVRLNPPITVNWAYTTTYATPVTLTVRDVPAGATVSVSCFGPKPKRRTRRTRNIGCPAKHPSFPKVKKTSTVNAVKPFAGRRLLSGTVLELRITASGAIGKVVRYVVQYKKKQPKSTSLCLPPGAQAPARCPD